MVVVEVELGELTVDLLGYFIPNLLINGSFTVGLSAIRVFRNLSDVILFQVGLHITAVAPNFSHLDILYLGPETFKQPSELNPTLPGPLDVELSSLRERLHQMVQFVLINAHRDQNPRVTSFVSDLTLQFEEDLVITEVRAGGEDEEFIVSSWLLWVDVVDLQRYDTLDDHEHLTKHFALVYDSILR